MEIHMTIDTSHTILNSGSGTPFELLSLCSIQICGTEGELYNVI